MGEMTRLALRWLYWRFKVYRVEHRPSGPLGALLARLWVTLWVRANPLDGASRDREANSTGIPVCGGTSVHVIPNICFTGRMLGADLEAPYARP